MPRTKKKQNAFRAWLDEKDLTLQAFASNVRGLSYGWASKAAGRTEAPKNVHEGTRRIIAEVYPDCPLAQEPE